MRFKLPSSFLQLSSYPSNWIQIVLTAIYNFIPLKLYSDPPDSFLRLWLPSNGIPFRRWRRAENRTDGPVRCNQPADQTSHHRIDLRTHYYSARWHYLNTVERSITRNIRVKGRLVISFHVLSSVRSFANGVTWTARILRPANFHQELCRKLHYASSDHILLAPSCGTGCQRLSRILGRSQRDTRWEATV